MINDKTKMWRKRQWLNPPTSSDNGYVITGQDEEGDSELIISDCSRSINLNLYFSTPKEKARVLKKLTLLRDAIDHLIDRVDV